MLLTFVEDTNIYILNFISSVFNYKIGHKVKLRINKNVTQVTHKHHIPFVDGSTVLGYAWDVVQIRL